MKVIYENNLDDLIALNTDLISNNSQFKKRKNWSLYWTPLFLLFSFSFFAYVLDNPSYYGGAVVGALACFFWTFYAYKKHPEKAAKQMQQKEVFCEHTITISDEGIRESTENSESYRKWSAINNISINDNYIFIYDTPMTAHIIPKRVIGESDFIKIRDEICVYKNT